MAKKSNTVAYMYKYCIAYTKSLFALNADAMLLFSSSSVLLNSLINTRYQVHHCRKTSLGVSHVQYR